jgi:hypothetical protein
LLLSERERGWNKRDEFTDCASSPPPRFIGAENNDSQHIKKSAAASTAATPYHAGHRFTGTTQAAKNVGHQLPLVLLLLGRGDDEHELKLFGLMMLFRLSPCHSLARLSRISYKKWLVLL